MSMWRRFHMTAGPGANILVVASSVCEHFNEILLTVVCVKWICVCVCAYIYRPKYTILISTAQRESCYDSLCTGC